MTDIPLRELRNNASDVIRRAEEGEPITVTVNGRPAVQLVPTPRRKPYLTLDEIRANQADPGLKKDLDELLDENGLEDSWERAERRWQQ